MSVTRAPRHLLFLCVLALGLAAAGRAAATGASPADPGEFRYEPLPLDAAIEVRLDASTPVFEFKTGKSAYVAYQLPASDRPYLIEVQSLLRGGTDAVHGRLFYPLAALLDEHFMVSRQTDLDALHFDLPVFENARSPAYRLSIGVDAPGAPERYLVLYTPAALFGARGAVEARTPGDAARAARETYPGAAQGGVLRISVRRDADAR